MKISKIKEVEKPTFNDVRRWYENKLHPDANDYNDQHVYEHVYHEGRFAGIFQLTSGGAQKLFVAAKPKSIVDIAVLTSIYRPGPLAANVDKIYLKAKQGEKYEWGHPLFEKVLGHTNNCLAGDTLVYTESGEVRLDEIKPGTALPTLNEESGEMEPDVVIATVCNGERELIELETEIGKLHLTPDHRVLTPQGWKEAGQLTLLDQIIAVDDYTYLTGGILEDEQKGCM